MASKQLYNGFMSTQTTLFGTVDFSSILMEIQPIYGEFKYTTTTKCATFAFLTYFCEIQRVFWQLNEHWNKVNRITCYWIILTGFGARDFLNIHKISLLLEEIFLFHSGILNNNVSFHWVSVFNVNFIFFINTLQHWKNIHMTQHN